MEHASLLATTSSFLTNGDRRNERESAREKNKAGVWESQREREEKKREEERRREEREQEERKRLTGLVISDEQRDGRKEDKEKKTPRAYSFSHASVKTRAYLGMGPTQSL